MLSRRTPGYYEHRCDSYKMQVSVPAQTFFIYTGGLLEGISDEGETDLGKFLV